MTKAKTTTAVRLVALLGTTALSTAFVTAALADEAKPVQTAQAETPAPAPEAEKDKVERVTVTATRRSKTILKVPYNISAISGSDIDDRKIQDNTELLRAIPGVSVVDKGQRNNGVVTNIRIRGLNVDSSILGDYAVSGVSPVSTYLDETPLFANLLLTDLERVEVLRGPQGTLYGSGSLGGTVRYISRAPAIGEFEAYGVGHVSQTADSEGTNYQVDGVVNLPLGDTAALRLVGTRRYYDGVIDYRNVYDLDAQGRPTAPLGLASPVADYHVVEDADKYGLWYGRASLLWQPSDGFNATLSYTHQSDDVDARLAQARGNDGFGVPYGDREAGSIQMEPATRDVDVAALEANIDLGFATLTSSSSWYDHSGDSTSENTGFYAQAGFLAYYLTYPRPMASADRTFGDEAIIQEMRLVSNGENVVDYIVGFYYQDQDRASTQISRLVGYKRWWDTVWCAGDPVCGAAVTGDIDFDYSRAETFTDKAVFGELTWNISTTVQATGGMRYFDNEAKNNTSMALPLFGIPGINPQYKTSEDDVLFKANLSWEFDEDQLLYAVYSEGYRRGGTNAVPDGTLGLLGEPLAAAYQLYGSDRSANYEVGVKGQLGSIRYGATAFLLEWDDPQLSTATPIWGYYATINGKSARSYGLELEAQGRLGDNVRYGAGYTYVNAELTADLLLPGVSPLFTVPKGTKLPGTPEHSFNVFADYTTPVSDDMMLVLRGDGFWQSETENALSVSTRFAETLDAFAIWNASASLQFGHFDATLWVKNVFDEEGITGVYTEQYMGTLPAANYYGNGSKELIALPRTIGFSLAYRY
ncbi:MAG: TonB-dependent receptor [Alphaproteobacteria bacterium]|nr:TonB-dependent receptor [Alphaproteobacteria bacterium]